MDTTIRHRRRRRSRPGLERLDARNLMTASGLLNPTFAAGQGSTVLPISTDALPSAAPTALGEAVQADGKVVVAGAGTTDNTGQKAFLVARYNADGTPDASFGTGGEVVIPFNSLASASAVAIQPDGKIVVGGTVLESLPSGNPPLLYQYDFAAARLDADGTPDASFGIGGTVSFQAGGPTPYQSYGPGSTSVAVKSVLLQADGSIVLAGNAENAASTAVDFAAARLTPRGVLDASFGGTGSVLVPVTVPGNALPQHDIAAGAGLQAGGQVVLGGTVGYGAFATNPGVADVAVIRLTSSGVLDASFGSADLPGIAHPLSPGGFALGARHSASGLALQPDGKIVLVGSNPELIRLDVDGSLDPTFGAGGVANASGPTAQGLAIDRAGNIAVLGSSMSPDYSLVFLQMSRFTAAGALDATFGDPATPGLGDPIFATPGTNYLANYALAIAGDGNVLVTFNPSILSANLRVNVTTSQNYFRLGEVLSTPTTSTPALRQPPADYDGSGRTVPAVYLPAFASFAYRPSGTAGAGDVFVPFGIPGAGQTIPAPGDYDGTGHTEIAAYLTALGDYAIRDTSTGDDRVFQFGTPGAGNTLPAPGDYEGSGKTDVAAYLADTGSFAILPADGSPGRIVQFGSPGVGNSIPAPADYFGTGHDDLAVYLAQYGGFAVADPAGQVPAVYVPFGTPGRGVTIPVPGDYDGSGHVELAVYIPAFGEFIYRPYRGGGDVAVPMGTPGAGVLPVPGDYDGSGHVELAVFDPATATFTYRPAGGGADVSVPFGSAGAGRSVPAAAPPGAPSGLGGAPGPGGNATRASSAGPVAPPSPTARVAASASSAVPGGPASAPRKASARPAQRAATDPIAWTA